MVLRGRSRSGPRLKAIPIAEIAAPAAAPYAAPLHAAGQDSNNRTLSACARDSFCVRSGSGFAFKFRIFAVFWIHRIKSHTGDGCLDRNHSSIRQPDIIKLQLDFGAPGKMRPARLASCNRSPDQAFVGDQHLVIADNVGGCNEFDWVSLVRCASMKSGFELHDEFLAGRDRHEFGRRARGIRLRRCRRNSANCG